MSAVTCSVFVDSVFSCTEGTQNGCNYNKEKPKLSCLDFGSLERVKLDSGNLTHRRIDCVKEDRYSPGNFLLCGSEQHPTLGYW